MKRMRSFVALIILCIAVCLEGQARVAPTLPSFVTPESGQTYYLYNVLEGKFSYKDSYNLTLEDYGNPVTLGTNNGSYYFLLNINGYNYYWGAYDSYFSFQSSLNYESYFTLNQVGTSYTIKFNYCQGFMGSDGASNSIKPSLTEGNIYWQFLSKEDGDYYMAKVKLYKYLQESDNYEFCVDKYEEIYNNPESTTEELDQAQATLRNALDISCKFSSPSWNEYPILFQNTSNNKWEMNSYNNGLIWNYYTYHSNSSNTSTLTATINVDEDVTFMYNYYHYGYSSCSCQVFLDGELIQEIYRNQSYGSGNNRRYYIEMPAGKHDITWICSVNYTGSSGTTISNVITDIGIQKTPTMIPATTTLEGQLGTEVLKLTDNVANVKKIIVNGVIGPDDWTTLGMMVNAVSIDLSGASATSGIPSYMFSGSKFPFLHSFKLPQGLKSIGDYAFYKSDVEDDMVFPSSLQSIGSYAFSGSKIKSAYMPDGLSSLGNYAFQSCYFLENSTFPSAAGIIPTSCFSSCYNLLTFIIPEGITEISDHAFGSAYLFNPRFPSTLKKINYYAFYNTGIDSLFINENMSIVYDAFSNCSNLVYAEFPTTFSVWSNNGGDSPISNCTKLKDVYFKSPAVVSYRSSSGSFFNGCTNSDLTIHVPDFLVLSYKQDPYWYNYNPVGFNSAEIHDWHLTNMINVTLNADQRFKNSPNVIMDEGTTLSINGEDPMSLNDFTTVANGEDVNYRAMVVSNTSDVIINGKYNYSYYTSSKKWHYICLPFDVKVSNITSPSCSHAVRYYDGASRAENGTGSNWKNYNADDIIPAGTGFIYQTSKNCWSIFEAEDNNAKNIVFSCNEFVKPLQVNPSETTANKGWNLVGNTWLTYYNIHKLNFIAPITVWDMSSRKYVAYSIIDDDYAITPGQAFFVQCPDELTEISFPIDGRQLTAEITDQNGARSSEPSERRLIDVVISQSMGTEEAQAEYWQTGEDSIYNETALTDKTRFVLNPNALTSYELERDASKFLSTDASVPQLYTIEDGELLAINERPLDDGSVLLGFKVASEGTYTITAPRCQFKNIILYDNETGIETELANGGSYTFTTPAGTNDNRFVLRLDVVSLTGIDNTSAIQSTPNTYFNLQGQRIRMPQKGLYIVNGKKVMR